MSVWGGGGWGLGRKWESMGPQSAARRLFHTRARQGGPEVSAEMAGAAIIHRHLNSVSHAAHNALINQKPAWVRCAPYQAGQAGCPPGCNLRLPACLPARMAACLPAICACPLPWPASPALAGCCFVLGRAGCQAARLPGLAAISACPPPLPAWPAQTLAS